jgi:hypothetical protein
MFGTYKNIAIIYEERSKILLLLIETIKLPEYDI